MKVYVVEDSAVFLERLTGLLTELGGVEVVGHAAGAGQALEAIVRLRPEVVLLDLQLAEGHGLQLLRSVKAALPAARVAVVTNFPSTQYRDASLEAGADFFLDKAQAFDELGELIVALRKEQGQ